MSSLGAAVVGRVEAPEHVVDFGVIATLAGAVHPGGGKMRLLILIILIILLVGAFPTWPYSSGWGYYPAGGLGTILIIVLILFLLGVI